MNEKQEDTQADTKLMDTTIKAMGMLLPVGTGSGALDKRLVFREMETEDERAIAHKTKEHMNTIEKALRKIEDGSFGTCEECSEEISIKRLEARPETTLCIRCKEDQERMEKDYT